MKVLVVIRRSPAQRFLVDLHEKKLVDEVVDLINRKKHSQAVVTALSRGRFSKQIADHEVQETAADMVLTEESAHWDLL